MAAGPTDGLPQAVPVPLGVVAAHAGICSREQVIEDRRALYRLAADLLGVDPEADPSLVDDPVVRHRLGMAMAGPDSNPVDVSTVRPLSGPAGHLSPGLGLVTRDDAATDLAPALDMISAEAGAEVHLLTGSDPRFGHAAASVRAGMAYARSTVPELFADLVGHVSLIAVLDPERSAAVVSASSRSMPGVVMLRPGTPLSVAESVIHESAHQRLFDLALTRDLLTVSSDRSPGFRPSWRRSVWPVEQTLAAFHAYACLTEFAAAADLDDIDLSRHSVLPHTAIRADEIGAWLAEHPDSMGYDANRLVSALLGRPVVSDPQHCAGSVMGDFRMRDVTVVDAGTRCIAGVLTESDGLRLYWLDDDATIVLDILRRGASTVPPEIIDEFERLRGPSIDTGERVSAALGRLLLSELATSGTESSN